MTVVNGNYLSAIFDYKSEIVKVWERYGNERRLKLYDAPYYFYIEDDEGPYTGLNGKKLARLDFSNADDFDRACKQYSSKYESDIAPLDKVLMNNYYDRPLPQINVTFIDLENDYDSKRGYSSVEEAYAPINAVTIYHQWCDKFYTLVVPPKGWDGEWNRKAWPDFKFEDVIVCRNDGELLRKLLVLIEDSDILSGWNSEFFDMPYLMRRTEIALGKEFMNRWCFPGAKPPKFREVERFGSPHLCVQLSGRVHIDFMDLFKKFTFEGRSSYSLGAITNEELDQPKLEYDGTLEELYNNDFSHFVVYNFVDVQAIRDLNRKFRLVELACQMARENTVPMEAVMGTVKYVETGVTNFAHHKQNVIVADKKVEEKHGKVEGAIVLNPKIGRHKWIGSVDLKSLYPTTIRAMNISPEMFIGQFIAFEDDWAGIRAKDQLMHILRFDDGETVEATGEEWHKILRAKKWCITAYGSIFDQSRGMGILPAILEFWYNERKRLQAEKKKWTKIAASLKKLPEKLAEYEEALKQEAYFDLLQLTKKIQLNSTYGALLNAFFRFGRVEEGASVTATGRQITTHMIQTIGEVLTGNLDPLIKTTERDDDGTVTNVYTTPNDAIIYGDTDSCYFKTYATNVDDGAEIADDVAETVNMSFPEFMREAFNCQPGYDGLMGAGREVVGESSLFQAKKKYVIKVVDMEGFRTDKIKSQGSELKKSDTPKVIQKFLSDVLTAVLNDKEFTVLEKIVNDARGTLINKENLLKLGVSKSVNNLDATYLEWSQFEKTGIRRVKLSGGQRASVNYNEHIKFRNDVSATAIKSGDKIMTFSLKKNEFGFKTIAMPADTSKLPDWFDEDFQVDLAETEKKLIDAKLKSIFNAIGFEIPTIQGSHFNSLFDF